MLFKKDTWSCAYHAIFNAIAIEIALHETNTGNFSQTSLEARLKNRLADKRLFARIYQIINQHVKRDRPLNGDEIQQICQKIPLAHKSIALFLTEKDELMIPSLYAEVQHSLTLSKQEIDVLLHQKRLALVREKIKQLLQSLKNKSNYEARYFFLQSR